MGAAFQAGRFFGADFLGARFGAAFFGVRLGAVFLAARFGAAFFVAPFDGGFAARFGPAFFAACGVTTGATATNGFGFEAGGCSGGGRMSP